MARYSTDNGLTWGEPTTLFTFPADGGDFSSGPALVTQAGTIHLFGLDYYDFAFRDDVKSRSLLWHARSTDGGKTWAAVQRPPFGFNYTGSVNGALQLKSGRILVPISAMDFSRRIGVGVSVVPYSDDDGATWQSPVEKVTFNTGAADWYESGAHEPVAVELRDGRVWMLPRAQDGYQWEAFSNDAGVHWSPPQHSRFMSNQSAMAVLRLRDGRLLLFWNNCGAEGLGKISWGEAERAIMAAAVSADEGKTWMGYREVARLIGNGQVSYPYATQAPDGHVILFLGGGNQLLKVNPEFLTRQTLKDDFSQGLGRWSTLAAAGAEAVPDPDRPEARVLRLRRPQADMPGAACLNFPFANSGRLSATVRLDAGFQGAQFALTDHYDLPGLARDGSFPFRITAKGAVEIIGSGGTWLETPGVLKAGQWHEMVLAWDCDARRAVLTLDGTEVARIEQFVCAKGLCYLRLRSIAPAADEAGLYLRGLEVSVQL
ncbi:MAG: exo-alpha-sialidase [Pirellulales bacterium]|nr:exo-alpha-sialidase [Pirellulales bacterium]